MPTARIILYNYFPLLAGILQPAGIFGQVDNRWAFLLGDPLDLQEEATRLVADQLHSFIDICNHIPTIAPFQLPDHCLDNGERHLAERLQRLVMMDAFTQVYLYAGVQPLKQLVLN